MTARLPTLTRSRRAAATTIGGVLLCIAIAWAGLFGCGNEPVREDQIGRTNWGAGNTNSNETLDNTNGSPWVPVEPDELILAVDTGGAQLGGYELTIVFDPTEIDMVGIVSANELFPVLFDKTQFITGRVRLAGMHTTDYGPSGRFPLARVQYRVLQVDPTATTQAITIAATPNPRAYTPVPSPRDVLASFVLRPTN